MPSNFTWKAFLSTSNLSITPNTTAAINQGETLPHQLIGSEDLLSNASQNAFIILNATSLIDFIEWLCTKYYISIVKESNLPSKTFNRMWFFGSTKRLCSNECFDSLSFCDLELALLSLIFRDTSDFQIVKSLWFHHFKIFLVVSACL